MKTSVVIPAHNSEETVVKTIGSILSQDKKFDEIILVDDGSSDKTSEIAAKYPLKIIKKEKGGEASALNAGIKEAKGEYIAIIEADVILPSNWLSSLLEELKNPEVSGVGAALEAANPENLIARLQGYELEYRYSQIKDKFVCHITSANSLFRKSVFDRVGYYDESLINASLDAELNNRIIEKGGKLVLRKDIKVKHFWKTDLISYLKRQFAYGFYRPRQGKTVLYPTDKAVVRQAAAIFFFFLSFLLWPFINSAAYVTLILFAAVILSQTWLSYRIFALKKDPNCFLLIPLNFFRNTVGVAGYILGVIDKILFKK